MIQRCTRVLQSRISSVFRLRRQKSDLWPRIKDNFFQHGKDTFNEELVARAYRWDNLPSKTWLLIYRNENAGKVYFICSIGIPMMIFGGTYLIYDSLYNPRGKQTAATRKISADIKELGVLAYLPVALFSLMPFVLMRIYRLFVLRIYQNRSNPEQFIAIVPKWNSTQRKMNFDRSFTWFDYRAEEMSSTQRTLFTFAMGNCSINKRRFLVNDEFFCTKRHKLYMFNETSRVPSLKDDN